MTRYTLELFNPDLRAWLALPGQSFDSATEAAIFAMELFDGIDFRAVPKRVFH